MGKLASLSSGLLARKGEARPAMRRQDLGDGADDLGWNDMGTSPSVDAAPAVPPVLAEREALAERVGRGATNADAPAEAPTSARAPRSVSVATATRIRRETDDAHKRGAKAAFTVRLDTDRHLRLRLASAIADTSSQTLMTEALDAFLDTMPEVEALVAALPPAKRR